MIMELFTQIQYEKKLQLIRKLLEERSKRSMFLRLFSNVQTMPDTVVMLTPEGTIVTIVETYYALRKAGASAAEALAAIENFRSMSTPGGTPNCSDLNAYVQYRVRLEHNRGRQMTDFEILRASSITSDFIEKFLGAGPVEEVASEDKSAHPYFMSELPHPEVNHPAGVFRTGEAMLFYYENPRTIGSVAAGIEPPYKYPQVVVVSTDGRPFLIIRAEQNASSGSFLCSLDANGRHSNWGEITSMSLEDFVRKAEEVLMQMKYGKKGRVELTP